MANKTTVETRGIDVTQIDTIKAAIDTYKNSIIKTEGLGINKAKTIDPNIKGSSVQTAFQNMSTAVKNEISELASYLDKVKESLDKVSENYKNQDTTLAGKIDSYTTNIRNIKS